jgi:hypothetical protein
MKQLPADYLDRAYAGVLGKLIGVYLGRPFEGWTYQRITRELGPIEYYVHERLECPLIVTDDDVAGTFTFVRALEDHVASRDITAKQIGDVWLNYLVEQRTILWWGGNGNSTEHTAWLNLKRGIAAPASGSIAVNGQSVAEQIGAQIFIDGWAIVSPGDPELAAHLAEKAGSVSHDGASVDAAKLWAAMEAEAFVSNDIEHLLEVGLSHISANGAIARLIADVRTWCKTYPDWRDARAEIEKAYGYDKYPGNCHVVPNHAIMIMAILYAPNDFSLAQTIINTSGWDTDCNAGNVGCLLGIKLGLAGMAGHRDWRGPIADRMLNSSADGGFSINDAVRVTYRLVNLGRRLAGGEPLPAPKDGAQFHFSLPGSVQGFTATTESLSVKGQNGALAITYKDLGAEPAAALTPTFTTPDVVNMRTYELRATPLVYSGQIARARVAADGSGGAIEAALRVLVYDKNDALRAVDGEFVSLSPGEEKTLSWKLPDTGGQPIQSIGVALRSPRAAASGTVRLDWLRWDGAPDLRLRRPDDTSDFWRRAWVNGVDFLSKNFPQAFRISQGRDEGMLIHGTREWTDYRVESKLTVALAEYAGIGVRVQGLRRYYAVRLERPDRMRIVKMYDGEVTTLATTAFAWEFDKPYEFAVEVVGRTISASIGGTTLSAEDGSKTALLDGGIALIIAGGAMSTDEVRVSAPRKGA